MTTGQTLSLVAAVIVFVALAAGVSVAWVTLRQSALSAARDRVTRGARQLAAATEQGIRQNEARYASVAKSPGVARALQAPTSPAADSAARVELSRLRAPTDSGLPIELWGTNGQRITFVGNDVPQPLELGPGENAGAPLLRRRGLDSLRAVDSLQLGALYRSGGRTLFWLVMPVVSGRHVNGFVAQQRRIAVNPQSERTVRELTGSSAAGYLHDLDGNGWTTLGGAPAKPPMVAADGEWTRPESGSVIHDEERVGGTPLVVVMEIPRSAALTRANAMVGTLALSSVAITLLAAIIAWIAGRAIAQPLHTLIGAAGAVAEGDYSARVPERGSEEVARLATSFNRMAGEIGQSRSALEARETELRALADTLRTARDTAESASRAKSDFLAAMSHELRTPLNAIGGYAELIEMGLRGPITDEQRRDLQRIRASQLHLLGIIGGILDMSRIESGQVAYQLESVPLQALFSELEALVLPQASAKDQSLVFLDESNSITVYADREKLRQVLINLLSNAIRHSPSSTTIAVTTEPRDGDRVAVLVCDEGPGIPQEKQEEIFEPFVQLNRSLTNTVEGVGLGLAISRDLARGMGGDITVESEPGRGTCFVLTLPLRGEAPAADRDATAPAASQIAN